MRERVGLSLFVEMKFVEKKSVKRKFIKTNKNQFSSEKIAAYMRASDGIQCSEEISDNQCAKELGSPCLLK